MNTTTEATPQLNEQNTREKIFKILNLSVPVLMGIFIFLNPFPHTTSIKEICFYLSVFIVLLLIYFKKIDFSFNSPLTIPFLLFVIWAFIGLFFALDKGNSLHDFRAHLLKYLAIYYILINFFNSRRRLIVLSWIIIISITICSIGGMFYFYIVSGHDLATRIYFQETTINNIGFLTLFAILLSLHLLSRVSKLYQKLILLVSLAGTSIMTLLTQSRGSLLGMILSLFILIPKNKKVLLLFSIFLIIITGMLPIKNRLTPYPISNERINIWRTYIEVINDYPIFGTGFGMEKWLNHEFWDRYSAKLPSNLRVPVKYRSIQYHPHNILVSTALRLGLPGLALFLYIIFMFGRMCYITIRYGKDDYIKSWGLCIVAVFVAWFVKGMFEIALSHAPAIFLYTIFAVMTVLLELNRTANKCPRP